MDLGSLKNIRGIDLTALDLLDPDKFLGESGIASIKGEMLDKGAVIAERSGESMAMTALAAAAVRRGEKEPYARRPDG